MIFENPLKVIARLNHPVFEPEADYERNGVVPNVVFPCGAVILENRMFIYYGGADTVTGVASIIVDDLLESLELCR